jgi:hypothetical protein
MLQGGVMKQNSFSLLIFIVFFSFIGSVAKSYAATGLYGADMWGNFYEIDINSGSETFIKYFDC